MSESALFSESMPDTVRRSVPADEIAHEDARRDATLSAAAETVTQSSTVSFGMAISAPSTDSPTNLHKSASAEPHLISNGFCRPIPRLVLNQ